MGESTNKKNELEQKALQLINKILPDLDIVCEYRFHDKRKWRLDFAIPSKKIGIEIEGGLWIGGRHIHPIGFEKDCEKYNEATALGWRILRIPPKMLIESYLMSLLERLIKY